MRLCGIMWNYVEFCRIMRNYAIMRKLYGITTIIAHMTNIQDVRDKNLPPQLAEEETERKEQHGKKVS
jgi:hypothetical protein